MGTLVRITRFVLLLILVSVVLSLIIAIVRPETGPVEKAVLALLIGACFWLSVWITNTAKRLRLAASGRRRQENLSAAP